MSEDRQNLSNIEIELRLRAIRQIDRDCRNGHISEDERYRRLNGVVPGLGDMARERAGQEGQSR